MPLIIRYAYYILQKILLLLLVKVQTKQLAHYMQMVGIAGNGPVRVWFKTLYHVTLYR